MKIKYTIYVIKIFVEVKIMSNLYVYQFCSRNKDNKDVLNFKKRIKTFLEYKENEDKIAEAKPREQIIIRLLRDKPSITQLNRTLASVAQQVQNRDENKWLFDFDVDDKELAAKFIYDIYVNYNNRATNGGHWELDDIKYYKTPHGYAIIVPHEFDTRKLMEKWRDYDVTLKKDELLFLDMITNGGADD